MDNEYVNGYVTEDNGYVTDHGLVTRRIENGILVEDFSAIYVEAILCCFDHYKSGSLMDYIQKHFEREMVVLTNVRRSNKKRETDLQRKLLDVWATMLPQMKANAAARETEERLQKDRALYLFDPKYMIKKKLYEVRKYHEIVPLD